MKTRSNRKVSVSGLLIVAAVIAGCGDGGSSSGAPAAAAPAPSGAPAAGAPSATASTSVPANISDSPSLFVAFVKALTGGDETSEALTVPDLKEAGDDVSEPQALGA